MSLDRKLRNNVVGNVWPQVQLETLHPNESYNGSQLRAITPIHTMMYSFMLAEGGEQKLSEFVGSVTGDLSAWVLDIANAVADHFGGMVDGKIMGRVERMNYHARMVSNAQAITNDVWKAKQTADTPRPEWCKHPEYVDTSDSPCLFSAVMAGTVRRAGDYFGATEKDTIILYDTAFLLAMLPAMAGLNTTEACLFSLKNAGLRT